MADRLDSLFPAPSLPPSTYSPYRWPGINPQSTTALLHNLREDYQKYHVFFNDKGFHNHLTHHLLAIWALGASGQVIDAAHKTHVVYQRATISSPEPITPLNFNEHLGDENFYNAYLNFFSDVILQKGTSATLEEYVFSEKANFDPSTNFQPYMLNRLVEGLVHPLIHVGYGLEFRLPGVIAEGLAQAAVHKANETVFLPDDTFRDSGDSTGGIHAFTVLARILKDPQFTSKEPADMSTPSDIFVKYGKAVWSHLPEWRVDGTSKEDIAAKIEQLAWVNTVLFGVSGWTADQGFKADFGLMHLVTSSIFLPSWVAYTNPASTSKLLRAYFAVCLTWWAVGGCPAPDITAFYSSPSSPTSHPIPPGPKPTSSNNVLPTPGHTDAHTPNPWLPIIQTTLVHTNEHLCKLQRALAHWDVLYGTRVAGKEDFQQTELEGADKLDGTLFVRIAGATADRLGWVREGEKGSDWDR